MQAVEVVLGKKSMQILFETSYIKHTNHRIHLIAINKQREIWAHGENGDHDFHINSLILVANQ